MTVEAQETGRITQTVVVNYLLYLPKGYRQSAQQQWPLILFLHGQLEWGDDPTILTRQGVPKLLDEGEELPAIVVSPQTPEGKRWWPRTAVLGAFLDRIEATYAVDLQRVYLTGISMGGYGVWALAMRYPQRFAALVPIAGGADYNTDEIPQEICALNDVPTWAFHGEMDVNVPYTESVNAVAALRACGGNVRLTLYPDAAHVESWERAYANDELWAWLFQQKRK
jgi:predicted peptidase